MGADRAVEEVQQRGGSSAVAVAAVAAQRQLAAGRTLTNFFSFFLAFHRGGGRFSVGYRLRLYLHTVRSSYVGTASALCPALGGRYPTLRVFLCGIVGCWVGLV